MYKKTVKRGGSKETLYDLFIANLNEGENEHSKGAVSHPIGSDEVMIRSTSPSYGAIPVSGEKNLKLLRDALVEICQKMGIEDAKGVNSVFAEGRQVSFIIQESKEKSFLKSNLWWFPWHNISDAYQHPQYALHYLTLVASTWEIKPAWVYVVVNGEILDARIPFSFDFEKMATEIDALLRRPTV